MVTKIVVKKSTYRDSITLMKISTNLSEKIGVKQAAVVMGTELNRRVLSEAGFKSPEVSQASNSDMIIAVEAESESSLEDALRDAEKLLVEGETKEGGNKQITSLEESLVVLPDANLVIISVPGQYAKREASRALDKGLNVFLFSSNVSRQDEVELKKVAKANNLLLMGPDCGTSIINHKILGFGNIVREGSIGLVSASGTGLQEVTTLIHKMGLGITQAIGTGGGDLSDEVGGITMLQGLELLESDPETRVIVLISKPPSQEVADNILESAEKSRKSVVVNFIGTQRNVLFENVRITSSLDETAKTACELAGGGTLIDFRIPSQLLETAITEHNNLTKSQKYIRGLFGGGTLCYESQTILQPIFNEVYSNSPLSNEYRIPGDSPSRKHTCIDMGSEEFVEGRPHPMIDFTLRNMRILQEGNDPETAVILLDVELGYGSNPNPVSQLLPTIKKAKETAERNGRSLSFVASVVGTEGDFQGLSTQTEALLELGVLVASSNAQATKIAAIIAAGINVLDKLEG